MKMIDVAFKFENGTVPLKFFLVQNVQQPKNIELWTMDWEALAQHDPLDKTYAHT